MEKVKANVKANCVLCGWNKAELIEADTEEELTSKVHKFFQEHAKHRCPGCGEPAHWHLEWGPVHIA
jgi:hypothetical protein